MVTRAYPNEYLYQLQEQNIGTIKPIQERTPSTSPRNTPSTEYSQQCYYIPREYWFILGIAVAGLVLALLLAIYELGKE